MPPLQYRIGLDPIQPPVGQAWLILQQSTDFEGWVVVAKAKTKPEAEVFVCQLRELEQRWFARQK